MNNKTSKNSAIITIVMSIIILAMLNICTFVIPFNKFSMATHFTAYGFATFVIVTETILIISHLFLESNSNQRIISLPIIYYGYVTLVIQIICSIVFYVINALVSFPFWIVVIIECFIIGFGMIQVAKGYFFKNRNQEYHERLANTIFMDEFRTNLKVLQKINKNKNLENELNELVEMAICSDPVTNDKTKEKENELHNLLQALDENIKINNETNALATIEKLKNTLIERNALCKIGK